MVNSYTAADRDLTLARLIGLLEADDRLEAAVVTGSLGAGLGDRWSDIDIAVVVREQLDCESIADDWIARLYRELPVAHHYRTVFGSTFVYGFLLANGLVVDLAFSPTNEFSVWAPVRVAFDRTGIATRAAASPTTWAPLPDWAGEAGFAWHDIVHACSAVARGRLWQANYFLGRVRNRTLSLASERHGWDADDFTRVDDLPPSEVALSRTLVGSLEPDVLMAAIEAATQAFLVELRRGDPALADRLEVPLLPVIGAMRAAV